MGKGPGVATCSTAPDSPPGAGGLCYRHVPRGTRPAVRQGRASVSPRVLRLQIRPLVREGSSIVTCPKALSLLGVPVHS
jgi:hypothetical protein